MFDFHPYLGKIPILTNIFQMGWNHQPGNSRAVKQAKKNSIKEDLVSQNPCERSDLCHRWDRVCWPQIPRLIVFLYMETGRWIIYNGWNFANQKPVEGYFVSPC